MACANIDRQYMRNKRNYIHISLEDLEDTEWFWAESEIERFDKLWKINMNLTGIAEELGRSRVSVLILALDRMYTGKVALRNWDIW